MMAAHERGGKRHEWVERRLVVHSPRHGAAAEAALRTRVAKAKEQVDRSTVVAVDALRR